MPVASNVLEEGIASLSCCDYATRYPYKLSKPSMTYFFVEQSNCITLELSETNITRKENHDNYLRSSFIPSNLIYV